MPNCAFYPQLDIFSVSSLFEQDEGYTKQPMFDFCPLNTDSFSSLVARWPGEAKNNTCSIVCSIGPGLSLFWLDNRVGHLWTRQYWRPRYITCHCLAGHTSLVSSVWCNSSGSTPGSAVSIMVSLKRISLGGTQIEPEEWYIFIIHQQGNLLYLLNQ